MEPEDQEKEIEMEQEPLKIYQEGGAVNSVNGYTGDVVLTTSDLANTSDYQNGTEVEEAINTAISGINIPTKTSELENDGEDGTSTYVEADDLATVATTGDYNDLTNRPTIPAAQVNSDWNATSGVAEILNKPTIPTVNDATLTITQNGTSKGTFTANDADDTTIEVSDTTYSDFTGTDGTSAGVAGLVPAPATTDAGKFLKADGTWDTAGGSGATELTSADYDYPDDNPDGVALWRLDGGLYYVDGTTRVYSNNITSATPAARSTYLLMKNLAPNSQSISIIRQATNTDVPHAYVTNINNGNAIINNKSLGGPTVNDTLTSTSTSQALSANQGKVLKDLVDSIAIRGAGAPTTSTVGQVGTLYEDTTNGDLYICTAVSGSTYTWEEVGAGGGGSAVTELTTSDYNWPTNNPTAIAMWLLNPGIYVVNSTDANTIATKPVANASQIGQATYIVGELNPTSRKQVISYIGSTGTLYSSIDTDGANYTSTPLTTSISQSTGTSITDVMSQNATTSMVFADPSTKQKVRIGASAIADGDYSVALGYGASAYRTGSVALGRGAYPTRVGEVNIGSGSTAFGYNNSNYRLLSGVYDGQSAHDAVTVNQVNSVIDNINSALSTSIPHIGA